MSGVCQRITTLNCHIHVGDSYSRHCALTLKADQPATFQNPSDSGVTDVLILQGESLCVQVETMCV